MIVMTRPRQLRGMGAASETTADQRRLQLAVRAWNGRAFTAAEILPVLAQALALARENQYRARWRNEQIPEGTGLYTDAENHLRQLEYLHGLMLKQRASTYIFKSPHKTWLDVRRATLDPIMWQSNAAAVGAVLNAAEQQLYTDTVDRILDLPGEILEKVTTIVVNTLEKGLSPILPKGVPGWVGPVVVGGVALGLGAWLYTTLKKVTPS